MNGDVSADLIAPDWVLEKGERYTRDWLDSGNEWIEKMVGYYETGGMAKEMAVLRVRGIAEGTHALDWDDNCPAVWGVVAAARLGIGL